MVLTTKRTNYFEEVLKKLDNKEELKTTLEQLKVYNIAYNVKVHAFIDAFASLDEFDYILPNLSYNGDIDQFIAQVKNRIAKIYKVSFSDLESQTERYHLYQDIISHKISFLDLPMDVLVKALTVFNPMEQIAMSGAVAPINKASKKFWQSLSPYPSDQTHKVILSMFKSYVKPNTDNIIGIIEFVRFMKKSVGDFTTELFDAMRLDLDINHSKVNELCNIMFRLGSHYDSKTIPDDIKTKVTNLVIEQMPTDGIGVKLLLWLRQPLGPTYFEKITSFISNSELEIPITNGKGPIADLNAFDDILPKLPILNLVVDKKFTDYGILGLSTFVKDCEPQLIASLRVQEQLKGLRKYYKNKLNFQDKFPELASLLDNAAYKLDVKKINYCLRHVEFSDVDNGLPKIPIIFSDDYAY